MSLIELASEKLPSKLSVEITDNQEIVEGEEISNKSTNIPEEEGEKELSAEIIEMFGDRILPERILAPAVHKDLTVRWEDIIKKGLTSEEWKNLLKKFPPPENCIIIDPPKINLEVKSALDSTIIKRNERIVEKQAKIAAAIAGIAKVLSLTLEKDSGNKLGLLERLSGVARLLVDLQRDETMIRRSLVLKNIRVSYRDTLKDTLWDEELFEKSLTEKLKSAKVLQQSSKDLKSSVKNKTENKISKNSQDPFHWNRQKPYGQLKAKTEIQSTTKLVLSESQHFSEDRTSICEN